MPNQVLLRGFVAVADSGSFTRAAIALLLGQPTISQHARKLEIFCERTLIDRDTRAVPLTDEGDALLGFAPAILAEHERAVVYFRGSAVPRYGGDCVSAPRMISPSRNCRRFCATFDSQTRRLPWN